MYASVVQWIVQPSHLRGRCGFARAVADRDALPRLLQGNGNAQVRRSASSQARRLGSRRASLAALPVAPATPLPKNLAYAAIFGSPIDSPSGVSADTRRKSAGIISVQYASVVQWIVQPSHLRGRCGFARAVADRDALPRLLQGNGNAQVRRSASSQARRLGSRRASLAALPVAPATPLPKNLAYAAIFGSPIDSPSGVSADTRRESAGISLVSYASVVKWI